MKKRKLIYQNITRKQAWALAENLPELRGDFFGKKEYTYYMTRTFDSWYEYDTWLTSPSSDVEKAPGNYNVFTITKIEEIDGKLVVEMEEKKS